MADVKTFQRAFVGGELSPNMRGRVGDADYANGCETLLNMIPTAQGPTTRRPGTQFVREAYDSTKRSKLITFEYSSDQQITIEIAQSRFRFHSNGQTVVHATPPPTYVAAQVISATASPTMSVGSAHNLVENDPVVLTEDSGGFPPEFVDGRVYYAKIVTSTSFQLAATAGGTAIPFTFPGGAQVRMHREYSIGDLVNFGGTYYYCFGSPARRGSPSVSVAPPQASYWHEQPVDGADVIFEVPNNFREEHLTEVSYDQSGDIMSLAHRYSPPVELRRVSESQWVANYVTLAAAVAAPTGLGVTQVYGQVIALGTIQNNHSWIREANNVNHGLLIGDAVLLSGASSTGPVVEIPDGVYVVAENANGGTVTEFSLKNKDTGAIIVNATAVYPVTLLAGAEARVIDLGTDGENTYVVTAIDSAGIESAKSAPYTATGNNLTVNGASNTLTWTAVTGAVRYRIYKEQSGLYGFIGETEGLSFEDAAPGFAPDIGNTPALRDATFVTGTSTVTFSNVSHLVTWTGGHDFTEGQPVLFWSEGTLPAEIEPNLVYFVRQPVGSAGTFRVSATEDGALLTFATAGTPTHHGYTGDWPGVVSHFEQRRCFAAWRTDPQGFLAARNGSESDFSYHLQVPIPDDDRIAARVKTRRAFTIRHMVPVNHLILLANTTEIRVTPINSDAITPSSFSARSQSYRGAGYPAPEVVNSTIVFVSNDDNRIYALGFDAAQQSFLPVDVSVRADHLFDGLSIRDMAQQKAPTPILWFTSTSGALLGMTYSPEQQLISWHRHETDGEFESVCVAKENGENRIYAMVKRTIDGGTVRYVERFGSMRKPATLSGHFFVDCGLTLTSALAVTTISNLDHLEGETVAILANGLVQTPQAVASGSITLPTPLGAGANVVHVGLPMAASVKPMPTAPEIEGFAKGRNKNVDEVWLEVIDSSPFEVGPDEDNMLPSDPYGDVTAGATYTGEVPITTLADWNERGQVLIRQTQPLPLTLVSLSMRVTLGGT